MSSAAAAAAADIIIRPIRTDDLDAFRAMRIEAVRDYPLAFTADLAETQGRPDEWWIDLVARNAGDGSSVIMVADAGGGRLAGMTGVWTPTAPKLAHAGGVWGVYVRPDFRGRGVGERLLRACIEWARTKELVTLKLSVAAANEVARRCYERVGFTAYGVEPLAIRWEGEFHDEIHMILRLA
jgi:ribosomal protein S18 acetylase RimI-like enzyme